MSDLIICPICGNEIPRESVSCPVCHTDLQALPQDIFPQEIQAKSISEETGTDPALTELTEQDLDSPIPQWLQSRFREKPGKSNFDFDSYTDAIFGVGDVRKSASPTKVLTPKPRKERSQGKIYQPGLEKILEPPLQEPDEDTGKSVPENIPSLMDFGTLRPAKKWIDPKRDRVIENVRKQNDKAFSLPQQIPLPWQQDPALTEDDDLTKTADDDDDEYINSVSPDKLQDAAPVKKPAAASDAEPVSVKPAPEKQNIPAVYEHSNEFIPESGSLLSDLMNEINRNSESLTPQEEKQNASGTLFYSGNEQADEEGPDETEMIEIPMNGEDGGGNAAVLDQILRGIGYQVESTAPAEEPALTADKKPEKAEDTPDPALDSAADDISGSSADPEPEKAPAAGDGDEEEAEPDAALIETDPLADHEPLPEKTDDPDEQEIPWDLFGSQDMSLPQSPEDPAYRTFSRSSIPQEPGSTTYQQRMMSSVLGKIIRAENYVAPQKKHANRKVSVWARMFWSLVALGGIVLILMTGITDRFELPAVSETPGSKAFYQYAEEINGSALVVVDYTPAYGKELDRAADGLIRMLSDKAEKVYISVLNPAAMPKAQELLETHGEKVEFSGWWPAGVISIRSRLTSGDIPDQIWLITSESSSVRSWAEQLSVFGDDRQLHVLSSGQLEPLLSPYLHAGMVRSAMSRDIDLLNYGEETNGTDRHLFAVWYMAVLLPLVWVAGVFAKFVRSDPGSRRKKAAEKETDSYSDKEAGNDSRL